MDAVNKLNDQQNKSADAILKQYNARTRSTSPRRAKLNQLQASTTPRPRRAPAPPLNPLQTQIEAAQSKVDSANVKTEALQSAYKACSTHRINSQIIQPAGAPKATGSNRRSTLEAGVLIGLVAGGLLGLGLAVWIDLRARQAQ